MFWINDGIRQLSKTLNHIMYSYDTQQFPLIRIIIVYSCKKSEIKTTGQTCGLLTVRRKTCLPEPGAQFYIGKHIDENDIALKVGELK